MTIHSLWHQNLQLLLQSQLLLPFKSEAARQLELAAAASYAPGHTFKAIHELLVLAEGNWKSVRVVSRYT